jgi:hypothetical protein
MGSLQAGASDLLVNIRRTNRFGRNKAVHPCGDSQDNGYLLKKPENLIQNL